MAKYNNNIDVINLIGVELFKLFETKNLRKSIELMKSVKLNKIQRKKLYIKFNQLIKNKGFKIMLGFFKVKSINVIYGFITGHVDRCFFLIYKFWWSS